MTIELLGDLERHILPSGAEVYYRDSDHSYWSAAKQKGSGWSGSGRLTGISTVVAPFDWRPDNLMRWAADLNCKGIAQLATDALDLDDTDAIRTQLAWLTSGDGIVSALFDSRLHYTQTRDDAATRGTNVHKHSLHALATGEAVPDYSSMTDEEKGYGEGVVQWWLDKEPKPVCAEQVVADLDLRIAGRLDLIADIAGERVLVDLKTSGFIPTKHHAQVAGYRHCASVSGIAEVDRCVIVQVTPDGRYEELPAGAEVEDFRAAVELYRRAAEVGKRAKAARQALAA